MEIALSRDPSDSVNGLAFNQNLPSGVSNKIRVPSSTAFVSHGSLIRKQISPYLKIFLETFSAKRFEFIFMKQSIS